MKKLFTIFALSLALLAFKPHTVSADCTTLYGGGVSCPPTFNFTINKLVQVPGKGGGNYVDNLSINDPKYSPSQAVNYKLIVTNTGSETIPQLYVKDVFPQYINFVSGNGSYDSNSKTLNFTINNLPAGQSIGYVLNAKTADANSMPSDKAVLCVANQVTATDTNGATDSDSSNLCIQKQAITNPSPQVLPATTVTTTPPTGPEMLPLLALVPGVFGGLILRKKSIKISNALKGGIN